MCHKFRIPPSVSDASAYLDGGMYAASHEFCPCLRCLIRRFGRSIAEADQFRRGFYDSIAKTDLDATNRIDPLNCPFCGDSALPSHIQ